MEVSRAIRAKLERALEPDRLEIEDQSHLHVGHAGASDRGESHFRVEVVARAFEGANRVARERMVQACLADELAGPVHALSVSARTPEEDRVARRTPGG